ncbi:MAG: hypothetical protein ACRDKT_01755 [Actinomycetota bacterium]
MAKTETVRAATGKTQEQWYALLDKWGAPGRPYKEIAEFLTTKHDVSRWWAQKLIVEYEQDRGVRDPGVRRNGTFEVGASKTVAVPVDVLFDAFTDSRKRNRWLISGKMKLRASDAPTTARFDWGYDASRVTATFESKGPGKSAVAVQHQKLDKSAEPQKIKTMWRDALDELKDYLDS